jgi:hypothetical protein
MRWKTAAAGASLYLICGTAATHSFGKLYTLPVPLWMYTWVPRPRYCFHSSWSPGL